MTGPLAGVAVVVVDVETTGWLPQDAQIIEIGAVRLRDGHLTGEFSSLVSSAAAIPADISALTGITAEMTSRAPGTGAALSAFLSFAGLTEPGPRLLVAHNAPFDLRFLTAASDACGIAWPPVPVLDTAILARLLLGPDDVPDARLATLAGYFAAATVPCHRALADAKATAEVLAGLLRVAAGDRPVRRAGPDGAQASTTLTLAAAL